MGVHSTLRGRSTLEVQVFKAGMANLGSWNCSSGVKNIFCTRMAREIKDSRYMGWCNRYTLVSSISFVPTTTVAGSWWHAYSADQETQRPSQATSLLLETYRSPTSFWSSWREDFIKSRSAVSCFFSSSWVCFICDGKTGLSSRIFYTWAEFNSPKYTSHQTIQLYSWFLY